MYQVTMSCQSGVSLNQSALDNVYFTQGDGYLDSYAQWTAYFDDMNAALSSMIFQSEESEGKETIVITVNDQYPGNPLQGSLTINVVRETLVVTTIGQVDARVTRSQTSLYLVYTGIAVIFIIPVGCFARLSYKWYKKNKATRASQARIKARLAKNAANTTQTTTDMSSTTAYQPASTDDSTVSPSLQKQSTKTIFKSPSGHQRFDDNL